jgi:hypothetical protein
MAKEDGIETDKLEQGCLGWRLEAEDGWRGRSFAVGQLRAVEPMPSIARENAALRRIDVCNYPGDAANGDIT